MRINRVISASTDSVCAPEVCAKRLTSQHIVYSTSDGIFGVDFISGSVLQ